MKNNFQSPFFLIALTFVLLFSSCSDFQRSLKSKDNALKYDKAVEYYNDEDWYRAEALFNDVMPIFRGTGKAKDMTYMYANCQYNLGDRLLAVHYFRTFSRTWPRDSMAEKADFMVAQCLYEESPRYNLEQSNTMKAIEGFQYFVNKYPTSAMEDSALILQGKLRKRLEKKSYNDSRLYYQLRNYKSAVISLKNTLKDFPESEYREEIMFLIVRSSYLLAKNSIDEVKMERFQETINEYYAYIDEFPKNPRSKDAEKIYASCVKEIKRQ